MWMQVGVAAVVIVVAALAAVFIRTLRAARLCLEEARRSVVEVGNELTRTAREATQLLEASQLLTRDIHAKLSTFEPLCTSVRQVGDSVHRMASSVRQFSATVSRTAAEMEESVHKNRDRLTGAAEWLGIGMQLWQSWQEHRTVGNQAQKSKGEINNGKPIEG